MPKLPSSSQQDSKSMHSLDSEGRKSVGRLSLSPALKTRPDRERHEDIEIKSFQPLHGILSLHARKKPESWSCLVCGTLNPWLRLVSFEIVHAITYYPIAVWMGPEIDEENISASTCLRSTQAPCPTCGRARVPSWLIDCNGQLIVPGSLIRCSRDDTTFIPSPALPKTAYPLLSPCTPRSRDTFKSGFPKSSAPDNLSVPPRPSKVTQRHGSLVDQSGLSIHSSESLWKKGRTPRRSLPRSKMVSNERSTEAETTPASVNIQSPQSGRRGVRSPRVRSPNVRSPNVGSPKDRNSKVKSPKVRSPKVRSPKDTTSPNARSKVEDVQEQREELRVEAATETSLKARFESQLGDRVVMVVAVHGPRAPPQRSARSLEGYCILEEEDAAHLAPHNRILVKVTLDLMQARNPQVIDERVGREQYEDFLDFGLCGRCNRTYRIVMGKRHVQTKGFWTKLEDELADLQQLISESECRKRAFREAGEHRSTLMETQSLKLMRGRVARVQRLLEPVVMTCPFCLRSCETLFESKTSEE